MAYGDSPYDRPLKEAWDAFCDQLKLAGDRVFKDVNPATALQRVDGFRMLSQNLGQAFDLALEIRDTKYPALHHFSTPICPLGSDNADGIYIQAWIDGESVYKITGKKGQARMFNIAVQGQRSVTAYGKAQRKPLHDPFGDAPEANIFGHELKTDWDGAFELYIGGEKRGPNWLPTTKDSRKLFMRQFFDNFEEESAAYRIERVGMDSPRPMATPEQMIEAMRWAGQFCYDVIDQWPDWVWECREQLDPDAINEFRDPNAQAAQLPGAAKTVDARRGRTVAMMRWGFENDEALIVEFDAYDGFYMFTNEAIFGNSMEYLYRPVSFTPSRTKVDPDGKIRLVMSAKDHGYANWVDNQAYTAGVLTFRNVFAKATPELRTRLVKFADLPKHMPADARRTSPEERIDELHVRFNAIRRRFRL